MSAHRSPETIDPIRPKMTNSAQRDIYFVKVEGNIQPAVEQVLPLLMRLDGPTVGFTLGPHMVSGGHS